MRDWVNPEFGTARRTPAMPGAVHVRRDFSRAKTFFWRRFGEAGCISQHLVMVTMLDVSKSEHSCETLRQ
jgi:hypothetical protein